MATSTYKKKDIKECFDKLIKTTYKGEKGKLISTDFQYMRDVLWLLANHFEVKISKPKIKNY